MKKCLITTLILLLIGTNSFGQKIIYDKPDFILHIAAEDSNDIFGWKKAFGHFNNDDYEDLVILSEMYHNKNRERVGKAFLYYGKANGIDTSLVIGIEGIHAIDEDMLPGFNCNVGDFNNDGYDDLALGTPRYQRTGEPGNLTDGRGYAIIFLSNSDGTGLNLNEYIEFLGYIPGGKLAGNMFTGDINGDKVDDLIMSAQYDGNNREGRIYIYFGGNEFDKNYDKVLFSSSNRKGLACYGVDDINGDGFDDIIGYDVDFNYNHANGKIHTWLGKEDISQTPTYSRLIPYKEIMQVGDLNNDCCSEIIISSLYRTYAKDPEISPNLTIIKGSNNFDINNDVVIQLAGHHTRVSTIRDINNDGINDVFLDIYDKDYIDDGYDGGIFDNTRSYTFSGDINNYINVADTLLQFIDTDSSYGSSIKKVVPADLNGDGEFEFYCYSNILPYKGIVFIYNANFASLAITYPNITGLEWKTGKEYTVVWESKGNVGPAVKLELYKGNNLHRIISENTDNDGSQKWTVPPELQTGSDFRIKISSAADPTISDFSDHFFTIKQIPNLKVTYPDSAGIIWYWGGTYKIRWQSWGQVGQYIKLELFKDNLLLKTINFSAMNEGYYQKSISSEETSGENFKIKITAVGNDSVFDFSDHPFAIFQSVGVEEKPTVIYSNKLYPNYPNPFNATTKIRYEISRASDVQIRIYNLLGKVVRTIVNSHQSPGAYELNWDGKDEQERLVAGGIFILEMRTEEFIQRQKITLLK